MVTYFCELPFFYRRSCRDRPGFREWSHKNRVSPPSGLQSLTHFAPTLRMAAGSRCAPLGRLPSGKCSGFVWGFGAETMAAPSSPLTPGKPCYPHPPGTRKEQARNLGRKGALPLCTPRQGALPPAPRLSLAARQRGKEDPLPLRG